MKTKEELIADVFRIELSHPEDTIEALFGAILKLALDGAESNNQIAGIAIMGRCITEASRINKDYEQAVEYASTCGSKDEEKNVLEYLRTIGNKY